MSNANDAAPGDTTSVSDATREAERREAMMPADAGPEPTAEEEQAAEKNTPSPEAAAHNKEMLERGANQQGEGRVS